MSQTLVAQVVVHERRHHSDLPEAQIESDVFWRVFHEQGCRVTLLEAEVGEVVGHLVGVLVELLEGPRAVVVCVDHSWFVRNTA